MHKSTVKAYARPKEKNQGRCEREILGKAYSDQSRLGGSHGRAEKTASMSRIKEGRPTPSGGMMFSAEITHIGV